MEKGTWLLLLYGLPTKRTSARVNLWRKLKKFGAIPLKTSAYVLPDSASHHERFQWLATQIRGEGGEATLIRVAEIEGLPGAQIQQLFNAVRAADYQALMAELQRFMAASKRTKKSLPGGGLEKFQRRFEEIQEIDFFKSPAAHDAQMLLQRAERRAGPQNRLSAGRVLGIEKFQNRTWLTRPRPGIDRVGSAWLIRKFIDPGARFVFGMEPKKFPGAILFDMADAEFSHQEDDCTFETLLKRFGIADRAAHRLAEMVHDADLEDEKFQRHECRGLNLVFDGWGKMGWSDQQILTQGGKCFEGIYQKMGK